MAWRRSQADRIISHLESLARRLEQGLEQLLPGVRLLGPAGGTSPHIRQLLIPAISGETMVINLDLEGIAVSAGSACSAGGLEPSTVLLAMGLSPAEAGCGLRISFGWSNTAEEVYCLLQKIAALMGRLRGRRTGP